VRTLLSAYCRCRYAEHNSRSRCNHQLAHFQTPDISFEMDSLSAVLVLL
jgi:hypothetical protein